MICLCHVWFRCAPLPPQTHMATKDSLQTRVPRSPAQEHRCCIQVLCLHRCSTVFADARCSQTMASQKRIKHRDIAHTTKLRILAQAHTLTTSDAQRKSGNTEHKKTPFGRQTLVVTRHISQLSAKHLEGGCGFKGISTSTNQHINQQLHQLDQLKWQSAPTSAHQILLTASSRRSAAAFKAVACLLPN